MKIKNIFKFLSICLVFPSVLTFFSSSAAAQTTFRCITDGSWASVFLGETPVLTYNTDSVPQSCESIASKLESAVNQDDVSSLLLANGFIRWQAVICIVKDETLPCKSWNTIMDIPENQEPDSFLFNLLNVRAVTFSRGLPEDQTNKRDFVKFGEAIRNLPK
jgi:hypothetical protein